MDITHQTIEDFDLLQFGTDIQMSGIMLSDNDNTFLVPLPELQLNHLVWLEFTYEDWKAFLRQSDLQETEVLAEDKGKLKKIILRKSARQIDQRVSWRVYKRDGYRCRYCGSDDKPLTVDHLVLWEDGGPSIEANLVAACRQCNKTRGNMKYGEWLDSSEYQKCCKDLDPAVYKQNMEVLHTLGDIPIRLHIPSRGGKGKKKKRQRR